MNLSPSLLQSLGADALLPSPIGFKATCQEGNVQKAPTQKHDVIIPDANLPQKRTPTNPNNKIGLLCV